MKVLVVGGTGFLGSHLVQELKKQGHFVTYTGRAHKKESGYVRYDVTKDTLPEIARGIDAVYYLSQVENYGDFPSTAKNIFEVNSLGPLKVIDAAMKAGCKAFFYASTGNVYAPSFLPMDEESPLDRSRPYSLSKIHAEEILGLLLETGMNICCLRIFGLYGSTQTNKLAAKLLKKVYDGKTISLAPTPAEQVSNTVDTTGGLRLSWLNIHDSVDQLVTLGKMVLSGEPVPFHLNFAGPHGISLREITGLMGKYLGIIPNYAISKKARARDFIADISLIKEVLQPVYTPLETAVKDFVNSVDISRIE